MAFILLQAQLIKKKLNMLIYEIFSQNKRIIIYKTTTDFLNSSQTT